MIYELSLTLQEKAHFEYTVMKPFYRPKTEIN